MSIRCREGASNHTDPAVRFYSLSRGAYSGTMGRLRGHRPRRPGFYSLSRGAYSGTTRQSTVWETTGSHTFLFAVARGVQRNVVVTIEFALEGEFLFAVARGVQRNVLLSLTLISLAVIISIRCREGRTAELGLPKAPTYADAFLFAVARGVQRNRRTWRRRSTS